MICRLCHGDSDGPSLCRDCHRDLATLYWSSGGLRRVDFPTLQGAGRRAAGVRNGEVVATATQTKRATVPVRWSAEVAHPH